MLDVASLQQFEFFSKFTLYAGGKGVHRTITNVVILDHEGFEGNYSDFHPGDFVITNLLYAKDNPHRIYSSFSQLIAIGVSAIAIKSIYFSSLPSEVTELAETHRLPVFFFNAIYIEDVILNIADYLRSSANYSYYENLVDGFVRTETNEEAMNQLLAHCGKETRHYLSTAYLTYRMSMDEVSVQRNFNQLLLKKNSLLYADDLFIMKYKKGLLLLRFSKEGFLQPKVLQLWRDTFIELGLEQALFFTGINDEMLPAKKLDIAIQRCLYANRYCIGESLEEARYGDIHLSSLMLSLSDNRYASDYLTGLCEILQAGEGPQSGQLMKTLLTYVECRFHIEQTGKKLFQHPNTIRYRLNKIKALLRCRDDYDFQVLAALIAGIR